MKRLTMIEKLDQRFPGLADKVKVWFAQGIPAGKIAVLLCEQYKVSVSAAMVSNFRSGRWVPEQELLQEKRLAALAAREVSREQAIKASLASEVPGEVK
jgi:hypothetical protein